MEFLTHPLFKVMRRPSLEAAPNQQELAASSDAIGCAKSRETSSKPCSSMTLIGAKRSVRESRASLASSA